MTAELKEPKRNLLGQNEFQKRRAVFTNAQPNNQNSSSSSSNSSSVSSRSSTPTAAAKKPNQTASIEKSDPIALLARNYLRKINSTEEEARAVAISIKNKFKELSLDKKIKVIGDIEDIFTPFKNTSILKILKAKLAEPDNNWKNGLLGIRLEEMHNCHYLQQKHNPCAEAPITFEGRFTAQPSHKSSYALVGTLFSTNRTAILSEAGQNLQAYEKIAHILDAGYSAYTYDASGKNITGFVVALGDGCGGHFNDDKQDKAISRTAQFACKQAVRILAAHETLLEVTEVQERRMQIVQWIKEEVQRKVPNWREGTTLIAARAVRTHKGLLVVGFSIGDSMLIAWSPSTSVVKTLSPARTTIGLHDQESTAIFPVAYQPEEIHCINFSELPLDTILIPLSDGLYDYLPCVTQDKRYQDGHSYRETSINEQAVADLLKPVIQHKHDTAQMVQNCLKILVKEATNRIETKRRTEVARTKKPIVQLQLASEKLKAEEKEHKEKGDFEEFHKSEDYKTKVKKLTEMQEQAQLQIGDDVTVMGITLPASMPSNALVPILTPRALATGCNLKESAPVLLYVAPNIRPEKVGAAMLSQEVDYPANINIISAHKTRENRQDVVRFYVPQELSSCISNAQDLRKPTFLVEYSGTMFGGGIEEKGDGSKATSKIWTVNIITWAYVEGLKRHIKYALESEAQKAKKDEKKAEVKVSLLSPGIYCINYEAAKAHEQLQRDFLNQMPAGGWMFWLQRDEQGSLQYSLVEEDIASFSQRGTLVKPSQSVSLQELIDTINNLLSEYPHIASMEKPVATLSNAPSNSVLQLRK